MIEFITHIVSVIVTAVVIAIIVWLINRLDRKRHGEYHITCEYKFFLFSFRRRNDAIEKLNELGQDGWEVASFAAQYDFQTLLILKRETIHTL
ncbi:MAG: hypothetical protein HDS04_09040 [Bacteroides sp.]|nr:hypothetical protein [Bacteroides sp.]